MNLTELSKQIRFDNASQGFDPTEGGIDRYLLLAISEICEAQEELRDGRGVNEVYYQLTGNPNEVDVEYPKKPCGFPVEIADAIIRLLDICGKFDVEVNIEVLTTEKSKIRINRIDTYLLYISNSISNVRVGSHLEAPEEVATIDNMYFGSIFTALEGLFWLCIELEIDIMTVINEKLAFNKTRPPKHGRKF